jgi:hypothetical protein
LYCEEGEEERDEQQREVWILVSELAGSFTHDKPPAPLQGSPPTFFMPTKNDTKKVLLSHVTLLLWPQQMIAGQTMKD